jgi:gas vesicle protein
MRRGELYWLTNEEAVFMDTLKVWAAFTVGVAAGASIALLYAPQTGERTRRQLRRSIEDAGDYLRDTKDDVQDRAQDYVKRSRDVVEELVDSARKVVRV